MPYKHQHAPAFPRHISHSETPAAARFTGSKGRIWLTAVLAHHTLETASLASSTLFLPEVMSWPQQTGLPLGKGQEQKVLFVAVAVSCTGWVGLGSLLRSAVPDIPRVRRRERASWQGAWASGLPTPWQPRHCGVALPKQQAQPPHGKLASGRTRECSNANTTAGQEGGPTSHLPSRKAQHPLPCSILENIGNRPTTSN